MKMGQNQMMDVQGKRVLVVGLARSGRAAAYVLRRQGATVTVTDTRPPWVFASELKELLSARIGVEFGAHRQETFLTHDLIVTSPGVPWDLPQLEAARQHRIPVVPEVEAASWFLKGTLTGVTGSNGKTTTTTLLGMMLEASRFPTFVGGNIGVALISAVDQVTSESMVVSELSSFQLEGIQSFHPHVAVLLNVTPNHLDRHPSFEAYVQAKARIFSNQTSTDYAVLNADDSAVMNLAPSINSRKIYFSCRQNLPAGLLVSDAQVVYRVNHLERPLLSTRDIKLRGDFNLENVLAAAAAACVLGADFDAIARATREFRGVEHRLEYVGEVRGVEFYNDSKATSVDATVKALSAFERGVHLIMGGKDKGAPYAPIRALLQGRVREVLLIGAAAERIAEELTGAGQIARAGDLEAAVRMAFERALPGEVVLLAPACSSYDQFESFEHRGRAFKQLIASLADEATKPSFRIRAKGQRPGVLAARVPQASSHSETGIPALNAEPRHEARGPESRGPTVADSKGQVPDFESASSDYSLLAGPRSEMSGSPSSEVKEEGLCAATPAPARESRFETEESSRLPEFQISNFGRPDSDPGSESPAAVPAARLQTSDSIPPAPEPQVLSRRELVYVYEVDAQELAPMGFDVSDTSYEAPEEKSVINVAGESPDFRGERDDEPLMFEVVTASGLHEAKPEIGQPKRKSQKSQVRKRKAGQTSLY